MTKTIFHNLDWYTNMLNTCDGTDADLKRIADIRTMKDFLVNQCVEVVHTPTRSRSHCRNLLRELDDATVPVTPPQPPLQHQWTRMITTPEPLRLQRMKARRDRTMCTLNSPPLQQPVKTTG